MIDYDYKFPDNRDSSGTLPLRQAQLVMLRILKIIADICDRNQIAYWLDAGTLLGAVRHQGFIPWDDDLDIVMPRLDYVKFISIIERELPNDLVLQSPDTDSNYKLYGRPNCKIRDKYSKISEQDNDGSQQYSGIFIDVFALDKFHEKFPQRMVEHALKVSFKALCSAYNAAPQTSSNIKSVVLNIIVKLNSKKVIKKILDYYLNKVQKRIFKNSVLKKQYVIGCGLEIPWIRYYTIEEVYPLKKLQFEDSEFNVPNDYHSILIKFYNDYMTIPAAPQRVGHHINTIIIDTRK